MSFNPKMAVADNLAIAQAGKKRVTVHLASGAVLAGRVGELGDHHVVLEALAQKDFYDALVRIDQIVAIEMQTRTA